MHEMLHNAAFHQYLHCLPWYEHSSGTKVQVDLENLTCDPLICTMNNPCFIVSNQMEEYNSKQTVKQKISSCATFFINRMVCLEEQCIRSEQK